jgi:tetratricopeptide (TPR) repeat protein
MTGLLRSIRYVVLTAFVLALPYPANAQQVDLNAVFRDAVTALEERRPQEAIAGFTTVIERGSGVLPQSVIGNVYWRRGTAHFASGGDLQALGDFTQAIELQPDFASTYHSRGLVHRALGDERSAIADFERAIELPGNDDATAFADRGLSYFRLEEYSAAVESYNRAIVLNPDRASYHNLRGAAYRNLEEYQFAIEDFTEAIDIDTQFALAYLNRGIAYANINNHEAAIADFDEVLRLDPSLTQALDLRVASEQLAQVSNQRNELERRQPQARAVTAGATPPEDDELNFGDDLGPFSVNGFCGDSRFAGLGMARGELSPTSLFHDATDCRLAFEAGTVQLRGAAPVSVNPAPVVFLEPRDVIGSWIGTFECSDSVNPGRIEWKIFQPPGGNLQIEEQYSRLDEGEIFYTVELSRVGPTFQARNFNGGYVVDATINDERDTVTGIFGGHPTCETMVLRKTRPYPFADIFDYN